MSKKIKNILFVHNSLTTFVRYDLYILQKHFDLEELYFKSRVPDLANIIRLVNKADLVFGWFASWHTFWPVLFANLKKKPSILVIGGYDTAKLKNINYGNQLGGIKKIITNTTIKLSKALITNSFYAKSEAIKNINIPHEKITVIYHGIEDKINKMPLKSGIPSVISVGNINWYNLKRKGLELFIRSANYLPGLKFFLIGKWQDDSIKYLKYIASKNVAFTGYISEDKLIDYYKKAHVYVQVSAHEAFGMSLAEAMLAGCIPIVNDRGALKEVVGDAGIYIKHDDPIEVSEAIKIALQQTNDFRKKCRERILYNFPLEKREKKICELIDNILRR